MIIAVSPRVTPQHQPIRVTTNASRVIVDDRNNANADDVITEDVEPTVTGDVTNDVTLRDDHDDVIDTDPSHVKSDIASDDVTTNVAHDNHVTHDDNIDDVVANDDLVVNGDHNEAAVIDSKEEQVPMETITKLPSKFDVIERQSAQDYITCLLQVLPSLFDVTSVCELDETLQTFASNFCAGKCDVIILPIIHGRSVEFI